MESSYESFIATKVSFEESAKTRTLWIGSKIPDKTTSYQYSEDKGFTYESAFISDASVKFFEEILNNAIDHYFKTVEIAESIGGPVTEIRIYLDPETGSIRIKNNGMGIPIQPIHNDPSILNPIGIIEKEYCGTNTDAKKDIYRVTGGINGVGLKVVKAHCLNFKLDTWDQITKQYFHYQQSQNTASSYQITPLKTMISGTSIELLPDYKLLTDQHGFTKEDLIKYFNVLKAKVAFTYIFTQNQTYTILSQPVHKIQPTRTLKIFINEIPFKPDLTKLMATFSQSHFHIILENKQNFQFPWCIAFGLINRNHGSNGGYIGVFNGIVMHNLHPVMNVLIWELLGSDYIKHQIRMRFKIQKTEKLETASYGGHSIRKSILNKSFIFESRQYYVSYLQTSSQSKTEVKTVSVSDIKRIINNYDLTPLAHKFWELYQAIIIERISKLRSKQLKKPSSILNVKYDPAEKAGNKKYKCTLIVPEGDSAQTMFNTIIGKKVGGLSSQLYGRYNLRGVIVNAVKSSTVVNDGRQSTISASAAAKLETVNSDINEINRDHISTFNQDVNQAIEIVQSKKLAENKILIGLVEVLGLKYEYKYELTSEGNKQFETLNYKTLLICTDQDKDGLGQICSLMIIFIHRFWPMLIQRGFVQRIRTPMIRVYQGSIVHRFYSHDKFDKWLSTNMDQTNMKIKYYKGLGTHSANEVINDIGKNIQKNIITITLDNKAEITIRDFYDTDPGKRKEYLSREIIPYDIDEDITQTTCTEHMFGYTLPFQFDVINRKLIHCIDGLIESQRKVLTVARKKLRTGADLLSESPGTIELKVIQLTGKILDKMQYQHGDASLNEVIIKMAQAYPGSNNIPVLVPISNGFGSRRDSRDTHAAPRYLDIGYNKIMDILYPQQDDELLPRLKIDGKECEPEFYIPILPKALMEIQTTASPGFKIEIHARDLNDIIQYVLNMILMDNPPVCDIASIQEQSKTGWILNPNNPDAENTKIISCIYKRKVCEIQYGSYHYANDVITITGLPYRIWSSSYKELLINKYGDPKKLKLISQIIDDTTDDNVQMKIILEPEAYEKLVKIGYNSGASTDGISSDPIIMALFLYDICYSDLNMIRDHHCVSFGSYREVIPGWYRARKRLYFARIERTMTRMKMKLEILENKLRYILMESKEEINIDNKPDMERERILNEAGFKKLNIAFFNNLNQHPENTGLWDLFYNGDYDYIDRIKIGQKSENNIRKLQNEIQALKNEIDRYKSITFKDLWRNDIEIFRKVYKLGMETKWRYVNKETKFM